MAKFNQGILGGFSGTVGTVVGSTWKGINYMRSKSSGRKGTATQAQLEQRAKFAICAKLLQPIANVLETTFKGFAVKMTGINSALSYALKNAVTGTFPDFTIDFNHVLISRGDLVNAGNPNAAAAPNSMIKMSWTDNSNLGQARSTDKMIIVLYCPDLRKFIYTIGTSNRSSGSESIDARLFAGKEVETFISVISENEKEVAESIYTGQVRIT